MDLSSFILDKCLIVVPVLNILGTILKKAPKFPDWMIPFVLLAAGIVLCIALTFRDGRFDELINAAIQGVLVTGASIFLHQSYKQLKSEK